MNTSEGTGLEAKNIKDESSAIIQIVCFTSVAILLIISCLVMIWLSYNKMKRVQIEFQGSKENIEFVDIPLN